MRQNRDDVLSTLREKTFSKDYLSSQLKHLQAEQNIAVSEEDFLLADKLNQQIEIKQMELINLKYHHPILNEKVIVHPIAVALIDLSFESFEATLL